MNNLTAALKRLSYAFFTKRCEICGEVIELNDTLCEDCKGIKPITSPRCTSCGCSKNDCTCKKNKNEYKQLVAPYYYEDSIIRAVHNFKDNKMPFLADKFADDIILAINDCYSDIKFDYITFVPLRPLKCIKRGYNQAQLIGEGISKSLGVQCVPLLKKVRYTGVQHHKSARERKAAAFGSYDIINKHKSSLSGKVILLVDDVKTTGSTLNECAKMLSIYGATVYATSFAITKQRKKSSKDN